MALGAKAIKAEISRILALDIEQTRALWRSTFKRDAPSALSRMLLCRMLVWRLQEKAYGGYDRATLKLLAAYASGKSGEVPRFRRLKSGTVLVREYQGARHTVTIAQDGYIWQEKTYPNLTVIARAITGTNWNGPRFFGLRVKPGGRHACKVVLAP